MVRNLLAGNVRLVITYWVFGVIPGLLYSLLSKLITKYYLQIIVTPHMQWFFYFYLIFPFLYFPLIYIAIWKSSNRYTKNQLWPRLAKLAVILGAAFLIIGAIQIINSFIHRNDITYKIRQEINLIAKNLPIKVDTDSEITKVSFNDNVLTYNYKLINKTKSSVNILFFSINMKLQLIKIVCNNSGLKSYMDKGINIAYDYADKNGEPIARFIIGSNDCE